MLSFKQGDAVFSGKAPVSPIFNSNYDGSFIAGLAQLRYMYSMPVERIVNMFQENGFELDKATAKGLLKKAASLFENLHHCLRDEVLSDTYLAGDETFHRVLTPEDDNDGRGSKRGYIWDVTAINKGLVYFFYEDGSRGEKVILDMLEGHDLHGAFQSDGLAVYKKIAEKYGLRKLSCFQHCRRRFYNLVGNPDAERIINHVSNLYHKENMHRVGVDGWSAEDNLRWRKKYAPPILAELRRDLKQIAGDLNKYPPNSEMHIAANYMLNEWQGLENIFESGVYKLDNNTLERLQRYISLSRHNSLFFGSHSGARRGAIFYSLACSCRLQGVNFFDYLSDVLNRIAAMPNGSRSCEYRGLLPDRWKERHQ